ncbi:MAG: hypothetical protein ACJATA_000115 [Sphingobacteriales bacterium]|jgi:hypothetical protein
MRLPSLFKTPKHRRFDFMPRYFDPQKEEMDNRVKQIKHEMGVENDNTSKRRPGGISFKRDLSRSQNSRTRNQRLILIIIVLSVIACLLLK